MKRKQFFAVVVVAALLLGCCGVTASAFSLSDLFGSRKRADAMPEAYEEVLKTYYDAMYADWYEELTPEKLSEMGLTIWLYYFDEADRANFGYYLSDINGDGVDELILGLNNDVYIDTIYQMFTLIDGELSAIFTCGEDDALYLKQDGTLLWEGFGTDPDAFSLLFELDEDGYVNFLRGYLLDSSAANGPYFSASDTSLDASKAKAISDSAYDRGMVELEKDKEYITYASIYTYFNGVAAPVTQTASASAGSAADGYFTHETLYDPATGVPTANVLVPGGWTASVSVNWSFVSTSSPGVATVTMTSPDGQARILMVSNQAFADMYSGGMHFNGGEDRGLYVTLMDYYNADEVQALGLENEGYGGAEKIGHYPVSDEIQRLAEEAAEVKLQSNLASGITGLGSEGTAADNLYRLRDVYIEYFTLVTAAEVYVAGSNASLDSIYWNVPISFMLIAQTEDAYDQYKGIFDVVLANSDFTFEFLYANVQYGTAIDDAIHQGLMRQSYEYILSDSNSWVSEAESSSGYDSSTWADQWSDVIYERNEYETTDGGTIKVDTAYDSVYQNGDEIYMGPDGLAPDGWTKLYTAN